MAGMPPLRCFNCGYDHGRFCTSLEKLRTHIRIHPEKKHLWATAFEQFRICEMGRAQFVTSYKEFDGHLSLPNTTIPENYADILHNDEINPKTGLTDIVDDYLKKK